MYKTKGKISAWAFGTGEKVEIESLKVTPWNAKTDEWYDVSEPEKREAYDHTCARMTRRNVSDTAWDALTLEQKIVLSKNPLMIFTFFDRVDIVNPELFTLLYDNDEKGEFPFHAWLSMDDLEKK